MAAPRLHARGCKGVEKLSIRDIFVRLFVVSGILWAITSMLPHDTVLLFAPALAGYARVDTDYNGIVRDFDPDDRSLRKLQIGNLVLFSQMTPHDRMGLAPARPLVPVGAAFGFKVRGQWQPFRVKAKLWIVRAYDVLVRSISTLILVTMAGLIALREPYGPALDIFFLCLGASPMALNAQLSRNPSWQSWLLTVTIIDALAALSVVAILHFSATFLPRYTSAFRSVCKRGAYSLFIPFFILEVWPDVGILAFGAKGELVNDAGFIVQGVVLLISSFILLQLGLSKIAAVDRRYALLVLGVVIFGMGANYIAAVCKYSSLLPPVPEASVDALQLCSILVFYIVITVFIASRASALETRLRRGALILVLQACTLAGTSILEEFIKRNVDSNLKDSEALFAGAVVSALVGVLLSRPLDKAIENLGKRLSRA